MFGDLITFMWEIVSLVLIFRLKILFNFSLFVHNVFPLQISKMIEHFKSVFHWFKRKSHQLARNDETDQGKIAYGWVTFWLADWQGSTMMFFIPNCLKVFSLVLIPYLNYPQPATTGLTFSNGEANPKLTVIYKKKWDVSR